MKLNTAQQLLIALGVEETRVTLGHMKGKSEQYKKKGPGRKHKSHPKKEEVK